MRIKFIPFLLALSLGFNIFCLSGYFTGRRQTLPLQSPQKPLERLLNHLKLQPEQEQELIRLIESGRHEFQRLQKKRGADVRWFKNELKQPQPDIKAMRRLVLQNEHQMRQARQVMAKRWRDFLTGLTPNQKQKLIAVARRRPELRRKLLLPPRLLDRNGEPEHHRFKKSGLSRQRPPRPPIQKEGQKPWQREPQEREFPTPELQNR